MPKEGKLHLIKYAPPPSRLPIYQRFDPREVSFFGRTNYEAALEEKKFVFGIKRLDRRRHMYILGKGGVGKSKLLELLIRQDIAYGHGLCLLAPSLDLINAILDFVPEERLRDIVLVNPEDIAHPVSFNPLVDVPKEFRHQFALGFVDVIRAQFGSSWTPQMELILRSACLALLDYPNATVRGFISLLTSKEYRVEVSRSIEDDMTKRFWSEEFDEWLKKYESDTVIPLINKLGQFISNPLLKNIFSQQGNKIDFEEVVRSQKIILVHLAQSKLTDEDANFFGSLFLLKLRQAGAAGTRQKDFYLYLDEVTILSAAMLEGFLNDGAKLGIACIIVHKQSAESSDPVLGRMLGSVGTIVAFRLTGPEAELLEKEMIPVFSAKDMINLGQQEFYIKMMIDGNPYDPFSAETLKVFSPSHESIQRNITDFSQKNYSISLETAKRLATP